MTGLYIGLPRCNNKMHYLFEIGKPQGVDIMIVVGVIQSMPVL